MLDPPSGSDFPQPFSRHPLAQRRSPGQTRRVIRSKSALRRGQEFRGGFAGNVDLVRLRRRGLYEVHAVRATALVSRQKIEGLQRRDDLAYVRFLEVVDKRVLISETVYRSADKEALGAIHNPETVVKGIGMPM